MRLFLAINLPTVVRREVAAATTTLRECAPALSWVGEPLLHLTLKFLGEQPPERIPLIQAAIAGVAARHGELLITLNGIGAFPNFRRPRVVWMGVLQEPRLELVHHDIEIACEGDGLGFEVDGRVFRPHLTLARVKAAQPAEHLRALSRTAKQTDYRTDFIVRSIDLMLSEHTAAGQAYSTLVSAALRSG